MLRPTIAAAAILALASCSSPGDGQSSSGAPSSTAPAPATPSPALACGTPDKNLVEWATAAFGAGTGPVVGTTLVPAATTPSGNWSVIGIDRAYAHDDGTLAGGASRSLALVNVGSEDQKLIPILASEKDASSRADWSDVSWTGETLAAGKRAAAFAVDCLDDARAGEVTEP